MKRYRILSFDFDSRVRSFDPINEDWDEKVKAIHRQNRDSTIAHLQQEFGAQGFDEKLRNFIDLGAKPFSVVAFHNQFYTQARSAFVHCQYYPALTGICALGERVLNHLVLGLRDNYKNSSHYKRVYRKNSFDNWEVAIDALRDWNVLTPQAEQGFRELSQRRNNAIHFNTETEVNTRDEALRALLTFGSIIETQFSAFGQLPWLFTPPGEIYLRRDWEDHPFIRLVYVPNALHVGYKHKVVSVFPWRIEDTSDYDSREVSDDDFSKLRSEFQGTV
ncbi:hypothetical protein ACTHR6_01885 [Ralstonia holmesii]|uniref:hypothetical protein n=1 Tax=Ralstonia TaxID=48736 RepID=UPI0005617BBC|nr:hypothetical protein [Ralstonia pickettii]